LTTAEFVLVCAALLGLFSTWWQAPRWLDVLPIGVAGLALSQLLREGYRANLLPLYLSVASLIAVVGARLVRRRHHSAQPRRGVKLWVGILGRVLGILGLFLVVRSTLFFSLPPADLSRMTWSEAFDALHKKLSREYAFGTWKHIDWDGLYATYATQIGVAEAQRDRQAYYLALLGYTSSIPDGHVWLEGDDFGTRESAIGGGYGLNIRGLDDGRVIARSISPGGPAAAAGIQWGAEILSWNGLPIETALEQTPVLWPRRRGAPATLEGLRLERYRLLVRSPVDTQTRVSFRNPELSQIAEATLTAVFDGEMSQDGNAESPLPPVEPGVILPSGYGYIKINNEHDDDGPDDPVDVFRRAIQTFVDNDVPGVILDVRGNQGGTDELVPKFVGHFFTARVLYENVTIYFQPFHTFIRRPPQLWIEPIEPHYSGPVVALVDEFTFSSGEGIPMAIQRLPQGAVIGFYGTYGSFGMTGGVIKLPEGLTLHFPDGQSLDAQGVIQLDSDASMHGGVAPTIRVPVTEATARALFVEKRDVPLEYAVTYLTAARSSSIQTTTIAGQNETEN
jgi:carboxyl-terminal processing protease